MPRRTPTRGPGRRSGAPPRGGARTLLSVELADAFAVVGAVASLGPVALAERHAARIAALGADWSEAFYAQEEGELQTLIAGPAGSRPDSAPAPLIEPGTLSPLARQRLEAEQLAGRTRKHGLRRRASSGPGCRRCTTSAMMHGWPRSSPGLARASTSLSNGACAPCCDSLPSRSESPTCPPARKHRAEGTPHPYICRTRSRSVEPSGLFGNAGTNTTKRWRL
jgi:hypothetical protein